MENKINIARFKEGSRTAEIKGIWQWDYGQILRIQGLNLPSAVEIHFSLDEHGGEAARRIGVTKDGVTDVPIPDSMVENESAYCDSYYFFAYIYLTDETSGNTEYKIRAKVSTRSKPEAFNKPEDEELFRQAIDAVGKSADRAEDAEKSAEAWAHGREDHPDQAEDNAKYYADQAANLRKETAADKAEVAQMKQSVELTKMQVAQNLSETESLKNQAQTSAEHAALSEQAAKEAETAAKEARAGAEIAEDSAEQHASDALDRKNEIDQKVTEFNATKESVVKAVNDAGTAQKKAVEDAGAANVNAINLAGSTKVSEVNQAGELQVQNVVNEGSAQKQILISEGTAQKKAIEEYANEAIEFREQVLANTEALGGLSFAINNDDGGLDITI